MRVGVGDCGAVGLGKWAWLGLWRMVVVVGGGLVGRLSANLVNSKLAEADFGKHSK